MVGKQLEQVELASLWLRLSKVCNRTLGRQVQEEGGDQLYSPLFHD